ncbi:MAG TPA: hypothetical protein VMO24_00930 [Woeseiaceae bacterium]|nr:hypothetical protein [Woeseiaceae bacterium]
MAASNSRSLFAGSRRRNGGQQSRRIAIAQIDDRDHAEVVQELHAEHQQQDQTGRLEVDVAQRRRAGIQFSLPAE